MLMAFTEMLKLCSNYWESDFKKRKEDILINGFKKEKK